MQTTSLKRPRVCGRVVVAALVGSGLLPVAVARAQDTGPGPLVGQPAPPLVLRLVGGQNLYDLRDRVGAGATRPRRAVVVSFFATWCKPCVDELPVFRALLEKLACNQLDVVLVGSGEGQDQENLEAFAKEKRLLAFAEKESLPFIVLADPHSRAGSSWGAQKLPTTFLVDGRGQVVRQWTGQRPAFARELEDATQKLVGSDPQGTTCTASLAGNWTSPKSFLPVVEVVVKAAYGATAQDAGDLRDELSASLSRGRRYQVVSEHTRTQALAAQMRSCEGAACGQLDPDSIPAVGKLTGAHLGVFGRISVRERRYRATLYWVDIEKGLSTSTVTETQKDGERFDQFLKRAVRVFDPHAIGPAPSSPRGMLAVNGEPAGARVSVLSAPDGFPAAELGSSGHSRPLPADWKAIPPGKYVVRISADGHLTETRTVHVSRAATGVIKVTLLKLGALKLDSDPSGARFAVSGGGLSEPRRGFLPVTMEGLARGTYEVEVSHGGFETYRAKVVVKPGEATQHHAELQRSSAPEDTGASSGAIEVGGGGGVMLNLGFGLAGVRASRFFAVGAEAHGALTLDQWAVGPVLGITGTAASDAEVHLDVGLFASRMVALSRRWTLVPILAVKYTPKWAPMGTAACSGQQKGDYHYAVQSEDEDKRTHHGATLSAGVQFWVAPVFACGVTLDYWGAPYHPDTLFLKLQVGAAITTPAYNRYKNDGKE